MIFPKNSSTADDISSMSPNYHPPKDPNFKILSMQVGPKYSASQNFSYLGPGLGLVVGEAQISVYCGGEEDGA
jgi:hypothetical protein